MDKTAHDWRVLFDNATQISVIAPTAADAKFLAEFRNPGMVVKDIAHVDDFHTWYTKWTAREISRPPALATPALR
jgi:hypothetical protein